MKQASFVEGEAPETPVGEQPQMQIPVGMISGLLNSFIGSLIATQLGQAIGGLAGKVTGAHDVGLPLLDNAYPTLVPQNIKEWATDLDIPMDEVRIFHALREAAIARLFAHNPWLVSYIRTAITDYGKGINIDMDAIQDQAQRAFESGNGFDPSNPESFTIALNEGIFTPQESPAQRAALTKLETVLALIDGWSEEVVVKLVIRALKKIIVAQVQMLHDDVAKFLGVLRYLANDHQLQVQQLPRSTHQLTLKLSPTWLTQHAVQEILAV